MKTTWLLISMCFTFQVAQGALRRCYTCRSRGELGSCKDPFKFNATLVASEKGVESIPCASGWCSKMVEGGSSFSDSEYGTATQRGCLPRGPSDSEERCAQTVWNHKKVFMCFCRGDLCNSATTITSSILFPTLAFQFLSHKYQGL